MTKPRWEPFQNVKARKPTVKKSSIVRKCLTEQNEQFVLVHWLRKMGIRHHHSHNGGKRDLIEAAKFKRLGCSRGFPDLIIPYKNDSKGYASLYIELKRVRGGSVSTEQKEWLEWLNGHGQLAVVCKGAEEAKKVIKEYFSGSDEIHVL